MFREVASPNLWNLTFHAPDTLQRLAHQPILKSYRHGLLARSIGSRQVISSNCTQCSEPIHYAHTGDQDKPGTFAEFTCLRCDAKTYVELMISGGRVFSKDDFFKMNVTKVEHDPNTK